MGQLTSHADSGLYSHSSIYLQLPPPKCYRTTSILTIWNANGLCKKQINKNPFQNVYLPPIIRKQERVFFFISNEIQGSGLVRIKYMPFHLICGIGGIQLDLEAPANISYLYNSILVSAFVPSNSCGSCAYSNQQPSNCFLAL